MSRVKIPYTVVRGGRRYWQAKPGMRAVGFGSRCFGPDGLDAQARALALYSDWLRHQRGLPFAEPQAQASAGRRYPTGSIGEAWQRWIRTPEWERLSPATRQKEWWPAWTLRIEPVFGTMRPGEVTLEDMSLWRDHVVKAKGLTVAHKAMKVWRRFWKIMAAMKLCAREADPSLEVRNTEPPPRYQRWVEGEVVRLVKAAWRRPEERALACIVASTWASSFSPGDVRTLTAAQLGTDPLTKRLMFDRREEGRKKTGAAALGTLCPRSDRLVRAFLADRLATGMLPSSPLFARADGRIYEEDELSKAFARLRDRVFPKDKRQLRDMRRSATLEAFAGGAAAADVATKNAHGLQHTDRLFKTYNPVEIEPIRRADEARKAGRRAIRARNGAGPEV